MRPIGYGQTMKKPDRQIVHSASASNGDIYHKDPYEAKSTTVRAGRLLELKRSPLFGTYSDLCYCCFAKPIRFTRPPPTLASGSCPLDSHIPQGYQGRSPWLE